MPKWRTTRNLSPSACYRETSHSSLWDSDKGTVFGEVLLVALAWTFFISPEERDDKGELIKGEQHCLSQPENEHVYSLSDCCCLLRSN